MQIPGMNFKIPSLSKAGGAAAISGSSNPLPGKSPAQVSGNLLNPQVGGAHSKVGNKLNCCG